MTTCYEVWRCRYYNRKTGIYESQELVGRDDNIESAMFLMGRLSGFRGLISCGCVKFDAGNSSWGVEFLDRNDKVEYWFVIAKRGVK